MNFPDGLSFDLLENYSTPSTLSVNSSNKFLLKFIWHVAPKSSNQAYFHETSEALNKSLMFHCATT